MLSFPLTLGYVAVQAHPSVLHFLSDGGNSGAILLVYGCVVQERDQVATTEGWITTSIGTCLVEATDTFFTLPPQ